MNQYFTSSFLKKALTQSLLILSLAACGGGGSDNTPPPVETINEVTGNIQGVLHNNGSPISGKQVTIRGFSYNSETDAGTFVTQTDAAGLFVFKEIIFQSEQKSFFVEVQLNDDDIITVEVLPSHQVTNTGEASNTTQFIDDFLIEVPKINLNTSPIANAGVDQNLLTGNIVVFDGSSSSAPDGGAQFFWEIISAPEGSSIQLSDANSISPSFTPLVVGTYSIKLTVTDGDGDESEDEVSIAVTKTETTPVANAGPYQLVLLGETITLDGTASADADGDEITYLWESYENYDCGSSIECLQLFPPCSTSISTACGTPPEGEGFTIINDFGVIETTSGWYTQVAELDDDTSSTPSFVASEIGEYKFVLTVTDGRNTSQISIVEIDVVQGNIPPIANAGEDREVITSNEITLDGALSADEDNDFLTYEWSFTSKPDGSNATLFNELTVSPSFVADTDGEYLISLTVNDGTIDSEMDNIIVTAGPLTVDSVVISADEFEVYNGRTLQLNAVAIMTDESEETITNEGSWSLSSSTRATISSQGLLTGIKAGTVTVTFTPNDNSVPATTQSIRIKPISEMGDSFVTSLSSSASIINGTIQNGSQFSFSIRNNTGETMSLLRFEVRDSSGLKTFTEDTSLLSGGSLTNGEQVGLTYKVNFTGALTPLTLEYSLTDPVTGESFKVTYVYSGPTFP